MKTARKRQQAGQTVYEFLMLGHWVPTDEATYNKILGHAPVSSGVPNGISDWRESKKMVSEACAVHPLDVKDATEFAKKNGVPTHIDPKTGEVHFRGPLHQRAYLKMLRNGPLGRTFNKRDPFA